MSRTISAGLQSHIEGEVTTLSSLVKITRKDGVVLAFTNCDRSISYDGTTYLASDGIGATEIQITAGTGIDNLDIEGALTDGRITETDIEAGLYDNAAVSILTVNRHDLADGHITELTGFMGKITAGDGRFTAEFRGLSSVLRQKRGQRTSATCNCVRLGDARCKKDLTSFTFNRTITAVTDDENIEFTDAAASQYYRHGIIKSTSGANDGIERVVKAHINASGTAEIELRAPFPFALEVGDTVEIIAGCDRTIATCRSKFANANNFKGQPHLPGNDKLVRIGRGSE